MPRTLIGYTFLYDHGSLRDSTREIDAFEVEIYKTVLSAYYQLRLRFVNMPKETLKVVENVKELISQYEETDFNYIVIGHIDDKRRVVIKPVYLAQWDDNVDRYKDYLDSDDEELNA